MSQVNYSKQQPPCGQDGCGNLNYLCDSCSAVFTTSTEMSCSYGNPCCSDAIPCDICMAIKNSLRENHSNPNVSKIHFHEMYGPNPNELYEFSDEREQMLRMLMRAKYHRFQGGNFFPEPPKITAGLLNRLIDEGFVHNGFEFYNNNCFIVVILLIFSLDRSLIERINTKIFAGFLMRYIVEKFLSKLFVERMLIELFRIEAITLMPESIRDRFMGVSCPNEFLLQLEESRIVNRGPAIDSQDLGISASIVVLEKSKKLKVPNPNVDGERFDVLSDAISHVVRETNLDKLLLFQFKEGFNSQGQAVPQGSGKMGFPKKLSVMKKELLLTAFTRIKDDHYQIVVCFNGQFFNFNSLSPVNEGHSLPIVSRMNEEEVHSIFRTEAHTCMFICK
jgi:hypothetical protein